MSSARTFTAAAIPLPFLGMVVAVVVLVVWAGGAEHTAHAFQEAGMLPVLSAVGGVATALLAGVLVAVGGPRPLVTFLAAFPWVGAVLGTLGNAMKVAEVIPMVIAADVSMLAAAGLGECLSGLIIGAILGAGALLGAAAGAALRGLGDDDDGPANLAGAAVNVAVAGAAIWSAFSAIWLRSVLLLRSSISVADAAMAAHVDPSSLDVVGAVIAVLGVAWLVAVAATAGARARVPVAALGLSLLMLAGTGQVAMSTVSGALIVDDDGEGLLRAPGSEAGRIAGAFVLRRGASISISGDADSFDGRVALGADVDAATLVAAVKAAEDGKQTTLSIITASPPPTSTATHSFLRRLDEVAKGQETTFALCQNIDDGERMPLAVLGEAWGTSRVAERDVITVGPNDMPSGDVASAVAAASGDDVCLVVGEPTATLRAAQLLRAQRGTRLGLVSAMPTPPRDDVVSGTVDKATIQAVLRRIQPRVRRCYERLLATSPSSQGRMSIRMEIGADGRVVDATADNDSIGDPTMQQCVLRQVRGLRFPPHTGNVVVVTYPFVFQPG